MNQFILALCGLPASGKSTLANAIQKALNYEVEIVRTDEWRDIEYYTDWVPEKEKPVRQKALSRVSELVEEGKSVIHDDTNYYTSMRHDLFKIALEKQCGFAIVHVATPVTVALQWNRERENSRVPDSVIQDIFERFDNPGHSYLWDTEDLEVSLEIQNIDDVLPDIVEILKEIEPAKKPKPRLVTSTEFTRLDTATRLVVSEFLQEYPEFRGNREVSIIRRSFLRKASERKIQLKAVHKLLWSELSRLL
ncbi:adenylyl-sulfate kinase [Candidatus Thorarchaeota archaeon]|nr:MAG: adenylyl-sulfate kinase [Candidatus Thorarchaeota archaeon]